MIPVFPWLFISLVHVHTCVWHVQTRCICTHISYIHAQHTVHMTILGLKVLMHVYLCERECVLYYIYIYIYIYTYTHIYIYIYYYYIYTHVHTHIYTHTMLVFLVVICVNMYACMYFMCICMYVYIPPSEGKIEIWTMHLFYVQMCIHIQTAIRQQKKY